MPNMTKEELKELLYLASMGVNFIINEETDKLTYALRKAMKDPDRYMRYESTCFNIIEVLKRRIDNWGSKPYSLTD